MKYVHGLSLIYFSFENKLANAVMRIVRLTSSFFLLFSVYGVWSWQSQRVVENQLKTKILEKFHDSIVEQTEREGLKTNDIEKLSNYIKDPDKAAKLISSMDKMINLKKNNFDNKKKNNKKKTL